MNANEIRHGYGHDPGTRPFDALEGSFAYHLRRHRHAYGREGISQRALAMLANVSRSFIENLERAPDFQGNIEQLLRVALALRQPIEALVSPERLTALRDKIERRRAALGGAARLDESAAPLRLAVTCRVSHLVMALSDGKAVLRIRAHRIGAAKPLGDMRLLIERAVKADGAADVIVEIGTKASECMSASSISYRAISFKTAKQYLVRSGAAPPPNKAFFKELVSAHPELAQYVTVLPFTGAIAMTERWRTARLIAATIALAAAAAEPPTSERPRPEA